tara:strand:- start:433 stop:1149 length:717 start_codon:yes stop_codon:yes gene_type:complete
MGLNFKREKPKHLLLSILYRLSKFTLIPQKTKLKLYLDLTWIYDRLAHSLAMEYYTVENNPARISTMSFLSKNLSKNQSVLDVGCSTGDLSNLISDFVNNIDGIDHNLNSITQAKKTYQKNNIQFIHGDALEHLKNISSKYDLIIMSHLVEHLENSESFLKEYIPYTSSFYIEVPDVEKTYHNIYRRDVGSKLLHSDDDHVAEFDRDELEKIFKTLNLTVTDKEFRFGVMRYILNTTN